MTIRRALTTGAVPPLQRSLSQQSSLHVPLALLHAFSTVSAVSQYALVLQVLVKDLVGVLKTSKSMDNVAQRSAMAPQSSSCLFLSQSSRLV